MSVEVRDFRRLSEDKAAERARVTQAPVQQEAIPAERTTGDPRFDKLLRAVEAKMQASVEHANQAAQSAAIATNDEKRLQMQFEYMFTRGRMQAFTEVAEMPALILSEETQR